MKTKQLTKFYNALLMALTLVFLSAGVSTGVSAGEVQNGVFHVNADEAQKVLAERTDVQVLDVRTPDEFEQGHIAGAINIDYYADDFGAQVSELDPAVTYLVHCRSGVRSGKSLAILKDVGITKLIHLDGGFKAWLKASGGSDY